MATRDCARFLTQKLKRSEDLLRNRKYVRRSPGSALFRTITGNFCGNSGWLELNGDQVYGVGDSVPPELDVVRITIAERSEPAVPLPASFVAVMNNGGGDLHCFDTEAVVAGAQVPIYCWYHEDGTDQELVPVADSFSDWLTELVLRPQS